METDDDDATIRERFSLVQSILFIDFTDILPAHFQEKMVESCGETMQFGLVSLITDSGGNSWCPWLYFLRAYHLDNLCSSKSDVRLRFWSWYDLKKLLNSTLRSVVPLAMFRNIISAFNLIAYCSQTQGKAVWSYKITFSYYEREICQHRQLKVRPGPMKSFLSWPHGHHQF